ncbi:MAG: SUMF1/EgtB/PvdO family nonheme iron enzyme [Candidatus Competibacteraceae bacterium]
MEADLLTAPAGVPQSILFARLCRRLEDELAMTADAARWAVEFWALALGLPVERGAPPLPVPTPPPGAAPVIETPPASPPTALSPLTVFRDRPRDGSAGPAMIAIPPGQFWMGSPESELKRLGNKRRHWVIIERPFAIGRYAVTFAEYDRFCVATGESNPMTEVGVETTARRATSMGTPRWTIPTGCPPRPARPYRLPTEAEREHAGRPGTSFWGGGEHHPGSGEPCVRRYLRSPGSAKRLSPANRAGGSVSTPSLGISSDAWQRLGVERFGLRPGLRRRRATVRRARRRRPPVVARRFLERPTRVGALRPPGLERPTQPQRQTGFRLARPLQPFAR